MKLADYKRCFELSYDQFVAHHSIVASGIHENVRYERIIGVTRVDLPDNQFFFFKAGELLLIYVSDDVVASAVWSEFESMTNRGAPEETVRSRAGKTSNQVVFAGQGIAASIANEQVDFIEIFPPCSMPYYRDNIYREPPLFIM